MGNQYSPNIKAFEKFWTRAEYSVDERSDATAVVSERRWITGDPDRLKQIGFVWTWNVEHENARWSGICSTQAAARRKARECCVKLPDKT